MAGARRAPGPDRPVLGDLEEPQHGGPDALAAPGRLLRQTFGSFAGVGWSDSTLYETPRTCVGRGRAQAEVGQEPLHDRRVADGREDAHLGVAARAPKRVETEGARGGDVCEKNACVAPTCSDGMQDGNETDVDCGGGAYPTCATGKRCRLDADCTSMACDALSLVCVASQCSDHQKDGNESDVDCGGGCQPCATGEGCNVDGRFTLVMQYQGNAVLYWSQGVLWSSSGGVGASSAFLTMQTDGNLVITANGSPVWNSGTAGHPGSFFAVQTDGNLVIYNPGNQPIWASNTGATSVRSRDRAQRRRSARMAAMVLSMSRSVTSAMRLSPHPRIVQPGGDAI